MTHANNWSNPTKASMQEIIAMASALEERGRASDQQPVNSALVNVLDPAPGDRLLEAGCGTGLLCRMMASAVTPGGKITGLDISPEMTCIAKDLSLKAGHVDILQFCSGMAETLPFQDASFDGALAARLLLHVLEPGTMLKELARVLRPGGKLVAMDWDFETVVVDHSDRELTRRLLHWRCDHYGGNNWSGRQLWRWMGAAGLSNLQMLPVVSIAQRAQDSLTLSLFRSAQVARDGGAITAEEHDAWVGELRSSLLAGRFFSSIVYFIVSGEI